MQLRVLPTKPLVWVLRLNIALCFEWKATFCGTLTKYTRESQPEQGQAQHSERYRALRGDCSQYVDEWWALNGAASRGMQKHAFCRTCATPHLRRKRIGKDPSVAHLHQGQPCSVSRPNHRNLLDIFVGVEGPAIPTLISAFIPPPAQYPSFIP